MAETGRVGGLELYQDPEFQRREWVFERVGWAVMALIMVAGLLGLFGTGPLSRTTATDATRSLRVEYDRFTTRRTPTTLIVHVERPPQPAQGALDVWFARDYLEKASLQQVSPQPQSVRTEGSRMAYRFARAATEGPDRLGFQLEPETVGRLSGEVGLVGGSSVRFSQFVYP